MPLLEKESRGLKPEKDVTDEELVRGCLNGDRRSEYALYGRYSAKMLAVCRRYCKRTEEAEDVFQDGFVKAFSALATFKFQGSFEGWLRRLMVNTAITYYQSRQKKEMLPIEEGPEPDVNADALDKLTIKEMMNLIEEMPTGYRFVFNMFAIEGFSHKEISEMMGVNEGTSRSQLNKARAFLQKRIHSNHNAKTSHLAIEPIKDN